MNATSTTRTLNINGMHGDACVQKVTGALKAVQGVTTQSVKVGSATIGADQGGCDAACSAIGKAGYKANELNRPTGPANDHAKHSSDGKSGTAPGAGSEASPSMNPAATPGDKPAISPSGVPANNPGVTATAAKN